MMARPMGPNALRPGSDRRSRRGDVPGERRAAVQHGARRRSGGARVQVAIEAAPTLLTSPTSGPRSRASTGASPSRSPPTAPTSRGALPTRTWSSRAALSDDELARAARLRWLSSVAAGLDEIVTPALLARGVAITNASGVHGPNIAEHVMAMILMFTRGMPRLFRAQLARRWERNLTSRSDGPGELTGKTLLIVGLGRIGEAIAARARPFGVRIVALKHDPSTRHDDGVAVDELLGLDALDDVLGRARPRLRDACR